MKQEPTDEQESDRARSLAEQCWLGPLCLLFWAIIIIGFIHGCAKGAECTVAWQLPHAGDPPVTSWRIYRGLDLLAETAIPQATIRLPDAPCIIAVCAVNESGQSAPTTLQVAYLTDQDSTDLKIWQTIHGYHREFTPGKRFYRTKIETP